MITTFIKRMLGLWMLVLLPALSYAEVPSSGHYENHFDTQYGVWDLTGTYDEADIGFPSDMTITQDNKGKIRGQGTVLGSQDGFTADVGFTLSGSIKSLGDVTRVTLKTKIAGTATDGSQAWDIKGKFALTGDIDKSTGSLIGRAKGKLCVKGEGCFPIDEATELELPAEAAGSWDLYLDIQNVDGEKFTGTARAILQNGNGMREVPFTLKGKYNTGTDLATLKLKGSGGKFAIQAYATTFELIFQSIKGKLLGQTVNVP
jgi:hypothetical protein